MSKYRCNVAANTLGSRFVAISNNTDHPAGCFWTGHYVNFNLLADLNLTNPENFGNQGGICSNAGNAIIYLMSGFI